MLVPLRSYSAAVNIYTLILSLSGTGVLQPDAFLSSHSTLSEQWRFLLTSPTPTREKPTADTILSSSITDFLRADALQPLWLFYASSLLPILRHIHEISITSLRSTSAISSSHILLAFNWHDYWYLQTSNLSNFFPISGCIHWNAFSAESSICCSDCPPNCSYEEQQ